MKPPTLIRANNPLLAQNFPKPLAKKWWFTQTKNTVNASMNIKWPDLKAHLLSQETKNNRK